MGYTLKFMTNMTSRFIHTLQRIERTCMAIANGWSRPYIIVISRPSGWQSL